MSDEPRFPIGKVGAWLTFSYVVILALIVFWQWPSFRILAPNEWGDFLAGTLGPVALIWVVLSFFLQGRELQHSVNALNQQAEELRNSVEQQKEMVAVSREAMDLEHTKRAKVLEERRLAITPKFNLSYEHEHSGGTWVRNLTLTNVGGSAKSLSVDMKDLGSFERSFLKNGEAWILQSQPVMSFGGAGFIRSSASVNYMDQDDNWHNLSLTLPF